MSFWKPGRISGLSFRQIELEELLLSERDKFRVTESKLSSKIADLNEELDIKQIELEKFSSRIDSLVRSKLAKVMKSMEREYKSKQTELMRRTRIAESKYTRKARELDLEYGAEIQGLREENALLTRKLGRFYLKYSADSERVATPTSLATSATQVDFGAFVATRSDVES